MEVSHIDVHQIGFAAQVFAARWFRNEPRGKRWMLLCGDVGCGKSHAAKALHAFCRATAFQAWEQHWGKVNGRRIPTVEFMEWLEISSPESCTDEQFARWMWDAERSSVLFLDDIGTETDQYRTGTPVKRLCHILNRMEGKFLLMTTNVRRDRWEDKWDRRVADRLKAAELIEINTPSFRSEVQ